MVGKQGDIKLFLVKPFLIKPNESDFNQQLSESITSSLCYYGIVLVRFYRVVMSKVEQLIY